jgi:MoaA/NifB/PqqE/SkfB family radical SAM enzyme
MSDMVQLEDKTFDPLRALPVRSIVLEITSKCNLRCTFCTKSELGNESLPGRDMDMPPEVIEKTLAFLQSEKVPSILLVGIGEPTFRKDWVAVCDRLVQPTNAKLNLNTNFGRALSPSELECLLRFDSIVVSIESTDATIMKEMRRAVDLSTIVLNIVALKTLARALNIKVPKIFVNCTLTQRNVFGLSNLAAFCIELGIHQLNISSLIEFESVAEFGNLSIEHFDSPSMTRANQEVSKSLKMAAGTNTRIAIQPRCSQLLKGLKEANWRTEGLTRICLQPWGGYTVGANGQIYPCCVVIEPFAHLDDGRDCILNGENIRRLRRQLLEGDLPQMCQKCSNAPLGSKEDLAKAVASKSSRNTSRNKIGKSLGALLRKVTKRRG